MLKEYKSKILTALIFIEVLFIIFTGPEKFGIIAASTIFTFITWTWMWWKPKYESIIWIIGTILSIIGFIIIDPQFWMISAVYVICSNSILYLLEME